jgi:ribokinase
VIEMLAPAATHIVFSQPAAERLAGTADPTAMVAVLKRKFEQAFICVTVGEQGCWWFDEAENCIRTMPAIKIEAVDTLAAGDIFHGTFALAIAEGRPAEQAIRYSSVAAALKCQSFGGRLGAPTALDVEGALLVNADILVSRIVG